MTSRAGHSQDPREHDAASELLPWYANGTLAAPELDLVERHLESCPTCQQELAQCRSLRAAVRAAPVPKGAWAPSPAHLAQVLSRVDPAEAPRRAPAWREAWQRVMAWLEEAPRPARWALALQAAALLVLAGAALLHSARPSPAIYQTLSREAPKAADRARLHVVFAEDLTEKELRALVQDLHGAIVDGPSPRGVYTLELPEKAAEKERVRAIAERVAAHPKVVFVGPFNP